MILHFGTTEFSCDTRKSEITADHIEVNEKKVNLEDHTHTMPDITDGEVGSSKKISVENLLDHKHNFTFMKIFQITSNLCGTFQYQFMSGFKIRMIRITRIKSIV